MQIWCSVFEIQPLLAGYILTFKTITSSLCQNLWFSLAFSLQFRGNWNSKCSIWREIGSYFAPLMIYLIMMDSHESFKTLIFFLTKFTLQEVTIWRTSTRSFKVPHISMFYFKDGLIGIMCITKFNKLMKTCLTGTVFTRRRDKDFDSESFNGWHDTKQWDTYIVLAVPVLENYFQERIPTLIR